MEKVQGTLEDIKARVSAAAAVLAGGDPTAALGRGDWHSITPSEVALPVSHSQPPLAHTAATRRATQLVRLKRSTGAPL